VRNHFSEIDRRAAVLVVSFARVDALADYREQLRLPFPIAADRQRRAYRRYGLERASLFRTWHPRVAGAYVVLAWHGMKLQRPAPDEDLSQLGGDFVLDAEGLLRFAHPSRRPDDRPSIEALLAALNGVGG
jgi:hypothetical protein